MMKIEYKDFLDSKEFESLTWGQLIKSFFIIPVYGVMATWGALWQRIPALIWKLTSMTGVSMALITYTVSKGAGASIGEIGGAIGAIVLTSTKNYLDAKTPIIKEPISEKIKEPTDEPKN